MSSMQSIVDILPHFEFQLDDHGSRKRAQFEVQDCRGFLLDPDIRTYSRPQALNPISLNPKLRLMISILHYP